MIEQLNSSSLPVERSQAAVALDNLIRRHLRVSDPRDPDAIARALRERYTKESQILELEATGLPHSRGVRVDPRMMASTSVSAELQQARSDLATDLDALIKNALLKDVHPELRGWSYTLHRTAADGVNAARFALDPHQRDRAMAARRLLGDYARIARYVGAFSPNLSINYRQLAKSLDEVAGVILVTMGESIAQSGYGGGRFLLQAPASELQARRDALIFALRNLTGTAQEGYGPNDWPRGLVAYRQFLARLEQGGLSELRALFNENDVARTLDELIHYATRGAADDLRALGATAQLTLGRFRRLLVFSRNLVSPSSPPLAAYLSAIQLFLDAFTNGASGYRLLYIARPPIVFYGLYGVGGPDAATQRLLDLVLGRGRLAEFADCFLGCGCGYDAVRCQLMLDKILYDVDRAIDLYVLGTDPEGKGEPEQRAAAYGVVIHSFLHTILGTSNTPDCNSGYPACANTVCVETDSALDVLLRAELRDKLWESVGLSSSNDAITLPAPPPDTAVLDRLHQQLCIQKDGELQWESLLNTMAPSCLHPGEDALKTTQELINDAIGRVEDLGTSDEQCPPFGITIPPHFETSLDSLANDVTNTGVGRDDLDP